MIDRIASTLDRVHNTESLTVKATYLFFADTMMRYFLFQYGLIQLAENSRSQRNWSALGNLLEYYSSKIELTMKPIPLLGDTYFSTGSFPYYRNLSIRLKPYYLISIDQMDRPLFWPLALHEIAHCKLSETNHIQRLSATWHPEQIEPDLRAVVEARIEESLCDIIATRLIGPSYPFAYITRLWAQLPIGTSEHYPTQEFRIECMATILDEVGLERIGQYIRQVRDQKLAGNWDRDPIAPLKDRLVSVVADIPCELAPDLYQQATNAKTQLNVNPPLDPTLLFMASWLSFDEETPTKTEESISKLSSLIVDVLERRPKPLNSRA